MPRPSHLDALAKARAANRGVARWDLDLPGMPPLSANTRLHWSRRRAEHEDWRHAAFWAVKNARVPPLPRCWLLLAVTPPDRRRRDSDNLVPHLLKPVRDGVVAAGVVPDDTDRWLPWRLELLPGDGVREWRHRLTLSERPIPDIRVEAADA